MYNNKHMEYLSIINLDDIMIRIWSGSVNSIEPGQTTRIYTGSLTGQMLTYVQKHFGAMLIP